MLLHGARVLDDKNPAWSFVRDSILPFAREALAEHDPVRAGTVLFCLEQHPGDNGSLRRKPCGMMNLSLLNMILLALSCSFRMLYIVSRLLFIAIVLSLGSFGNSIYPIFLHAK
jgi:hypothetical protein